MKLNVAPIKTDSDFPSADDDQGCLDRLHDRRSNIVDVVIPHIEGVIKNARDAWGHEVHVLIAVIPMTKDYRDVGVIHVDTFKGNPDGLLSVARSIAVAAMGEGEHVPLQTKH